MAVYTTGGGVAPKRVDENTLLLLHGESIADASLFGRPITNNGVTVSTAQSKFGGKSLYFNGAASLDIEAGFTMGAADFTIDWWQYRQNNGTVATVNYYENAISSLLMQHMDGAKLYSSYNGSTWNAVEGEPAFQNEQNVWVHWAVVRNGNTLTTYRNGVRYWGKTISGAYSGTGKILIGSHAHPDNRDFFQGYIDEFRVSSVARWLGNFSPPTKPY